MNRINSPLAGMRNCVQKVIDYYENQTEDEAVAEDEEAFRHEFIARMEIPTELVSTEE